MKEIIGSLLLVIFLCLSVTSVALGSSHQGGTPEGEMTEYAEMTDVPALNIGDNWTYTREVNSESGDMGSIYFMENFTYTVSEIGTYTYNGTEHYGYNLTLEGKIIEGDLGSMGIEIDSGEVEGYLFLRMSDLGVVADYQWRHMKGNLSYQGEVYPANIIRETLTHDDPTVEKYDFPIRSGGEFKTNTTKRTRSYQKIDVEGLIENEGTSYQNTTTEQNIVTSPTKEDVSVPAGSFSTFELNKTSPNEQGYTTYNYVSDVKRHVKSVSRIPQNNTRIKEELSDFNVAERSESLSISPRSGKPGEQVTVSGSFPDYPNEDIRIWIPEADEEYSVTTGSNGDFNLNIEVPHASDRTPSPGKMGSLGVIAELQNSPTEAYSVSTLEVEGIATVDITSPEEDDLILESDVTVEWDSQFADSHEVRLNESDWEEPDTPTSHTFNLEDGPHMIEVKAIGESETDTDKVNITVDATPPQIDIVSPEEGEIITEDEVTIEWTGEGGPVGIENYKVRRNGVDWIEVDTEGTESPYLYTFSNLEDKEHTVEVKGQDVEGRNGTESVTFNVETEPKIEVLDFSVMPNQGPVPLDANITAEVENGGYVDGKVEIYASSDKIHEETIPGEDTVEIETEHTFEEPGEVQVELRDETGEALRDQTVVVQEEYDLTINIDGEGSTNPSEGTHSYAEGEEVTVEATPADGWYFDGWTGDEEGLGEEMTITMNEDMEITAQFKQETVEYDLTINIDGEGSVDPSEGTHTYEEGEEVTITATADEGWSFKEWTGTDESGEEITITMDDDKEITATFEEDDDGGNGGGIPGFTLPLLTLSTLIAVLVYHKRYYR